MLSWDGERCFVVCTYPACSSTVLSMGAWADSVSGSYDSSGDEHSGMGLSGDKHRNFF